MKDSYTEKFLGNVANEEENINGMQVIEKELEDLLKKVNSGLDDHEKIQFIAIVNDVWEPEKLFVTNTM